MTWQLCDRGEVPQIRNRAGEPAYLTPYFYLFCARRCIIHQYFVVLCNVTYGHGTLFQRPAARWLASVFRICTLSPTITAYGIAFPTTASSCSASRTWNKFLGAWIYCETHFSREKSTQSFLSSMLTQGSGIQFPVESLLPPPNSTGNLR